MSGVSIALGAVAVLAAVSRARKSGSRNNTDWTYARGELIEQVPGGEVRRIPVRKGRKGTWTEPFVPEGTDEIYLAVDQDGPDSRSGDYSKEVLSHLTWEREKEESPPGRRSLRGNRPPPIQRLPSVTSVGYLVDPRDPSRFRRLYRTKRYQMPLRKADGAAAWKQYRALEACWKAAVEEIRRDVYARHGIKDAAYFMIFDGHRVADRTVECARAHPDVPRDLADALDQLRMGMSDYGSDYSFEFAPRNLAADRGQLVLVDVMVPQEAMRRIRNREADAARARERERRQRMWRY